MPLALVVPGLLDVDADALAACPPLRRIAARARVRNVDDGDAALLRALRTDAAAAPLAALGAGLDAGGDWVARADPIATLLTHEDVRIVARVDDLDDDEAQALLALLARHFADDGLGFAAPRRDAWFVRSASPHFIDTVPLAAAVGRPLRALLPRGADARRWRRWWTEVQMLLHEHALAAREAASVNALWFSGAGTLPLTPLAPTLAFAGVSRFGDVVRGVARFAGTQPRTLRELPGALAGGSATQVAVAADPIDGADALRAFADDVLQPIVDALDRGRLDALALIGTGGAHAAQWDVAHGGPLDRWLRRGAPFAVPPRADA